MLFLCPFGMFVFPKLVAWYLSAFSAMVEVLIDNRTLIKITDFEIDFMQPARLTLDGMTSLTVFSEYPAIAADATANPNRLVHDTPPS